MSDVFADTFYFVAMHEPGGLSHDRAVAATVNRAGKLVTTAWVLTELANFFYRPLHRPLFLQTYDALRNNPDVTIVEPTQELFEAGIQLFAQRTDKEWSLTDCISIVVMNRLKIRDILTADHHFEQAGFKALLKP